MLLCCSLVSACSYVLPAALQLLSVLLWIPELLTLPSELSLNITLVTTHSMLLLFVEFRILAKATLYRVGHHVVPTKCTFQAAYSCPQLSSKFNLLADFILIII